jgi:hypothetical protein
MIHGYEEYAEVESLQTLAPQATILDEAQITWVKCPIDFPVESNVKLLTRPLKLLASLYQKSTASLIGKVVTSKIDVETA